MDLRAALALSCVAHLLVLVPFSFLLATSGANLEVGSYTIELDYIRIADAVTKARENAPASSPRDVPPQDAVPAPAAPRQEVASVAKTPEEARPPQAEKDAAGPMSARGPSRALSTSEERIARKEGMRYSQLVREKIRRVLQARYGRSASRRGDVFVEFTVDKRGNLLHHEIDGVRSTRDEVLLSMVGASLKEASPFPPLPPGAAKKKGLTFTLLISFKEQ